MNTKIIRAVLDENWKHSEGFVAIAEVDIGGFISPDSLNSPEAAALDYERARQADLGHRALQVLEVLAERPVADVSDTTLAEIQRVVRDLWSGK